MLRTALLRARPRSLGLAALLLLALAPPAHALRWRTCPDLDGLTCTTVTVPLDRSGVDPGHVRLRVAQVETEEAQPTLMYLSGGPGGAGVSEMVNVLFTVPTLAQRYRVIGFDQRGTGRSGLLRCPEIEKDARLRSPSAAAACAARLGAARRHYTTPDSVEDMEAIRRALGVQRVTLFGISYGTELALEYTRAHPDRVDRLIIDSVLDPDDRDPFFLTGFRAMPPTLRALCPGGCRGISADPATDLSQLVARLRAHPVRSAYYDARGRRHRREIGPTALFDLMFDADYNTALRAAIPAAVRAGLGGDLAPLARLVHEGDGLAQLGPPRDFSSARYATVCEETPLPWDPGTPIDQRQAVSDQRAAAQGAAAFFPFDPPTAAEDEISLCLRWPDVPHPAPSQSPPPYPAVPTLILQGGEDLRTPPEESARVAARIPGAVRVVVPGAGHAITGSDPSGCGVRALLRFVADRTVPTNCRRVPTDVPAVLAPPDSFTALKPAPHLPARIGRTVAAVGASVDDLRIVLSPALLERSGGGLRGGTWAVRDEELVLDRYEAVPGVTLTGRTRHGRLRLRVRGRAAAAGTVTIHRGRITGRLGGRRISARLRTGIPATATRARIARIARAPR
jgi:pimeloyl-ACP methyl ester carboxylesterase